MGMPGIPCLYYGSEWGEEGTKAPTDAESVTVVIKGSANLSGVTIKYI